LERAASVMAVSAPMLRVAATLAGVLALAAVTALYGRALPS
jgi:hypothetical protein